MVLEITARNVCDAYVESLIKLKTCGKVGPSRNGDVLYSPEPAYLTIRKPDERVLFDEVRDCNPYFHLMEAIWMLSGSNNVVWLEYFNSRYRDYADKGTDTVHGAYGHRWRNHFGGDQLRRVCSLLQDDPNTRRAVVGMWDPAVDLDHHADIPCNTQLIFSIRNGALDMLVINRSNDLIWGMLGANVVHMTMLQELMAREIGVPTGNYSVFTNNLHIYTNLEKYTEILSTIVVEDRYGILEPYPLLREGESLSGFFTDCEKFVKGDILGTRCAWFSGVALPMFLSYRERKEKLGNGAGYANQIKAEDWRLACLQYIARKTQSSST